mgnify:CR=1 FL=1
MRSGHRSHRTCGAAAKPGRGARPLWTLLAAEEDGQSPARDGDDVAEVESNEEEEGSESATSMVDKVDQRTHGEEEEKPHSIGNAPEVVHDTSSCGLFLVCW